MSRVLISSENGVLRNAFGCLGAAIFLPIALIVKLIVSPFEKPIRRTPDEVAGHIRAMLDRTIWDENSEYDYDEFSCVPITDDQLESIARRACEAFELPSGPDRAALESLLAETEIVARRPN